MGEKRKLEQGDAKTISYTNTAYNLNKIHTGENHLPRLS